MTVSTLRHNYYKNNPDGQYFDYDTLKFFGERESEMRVLKDIVKVRDISGDLHDAYCLSSLQRKAPGGPRRHYAYFDCETCSPIVTKD